MREINARTQAGQEPEGGADAVAWGSVTYWLVPHDLPSLLSFFFGLSFFVLFRFIIVGCFT